MIEYVNNGMYIEFEGRTYFVVEPVDVDRIVQTIISNLWGSNIEEELRNGYYPFYRQFLIEKEDIKESIINRLKDNGKKD